MKNPYPKTIEDECSSQVFEDERHKAWNEGVKARDKQVLKWLRDHSFKLIAYELGLDMEEGLDEK